VASLSRQFAAWAAGLAYDDLPAAVVDRAKGVTLQGLASALLGYDSNAGRNALQLMKDEEAGGAGVATVWVDGSKLTKGGAAFVNSELVLAGGKWDTYKMLTHPGVAILPAAMIAAELEGADGRAYLTGVVAGYEVLERMARDFVPAVMARGFHSGPIFGIFGAAMAAAKIMGLNEDQLNSVIGQCVNLAAGNLEGARSGGRRTSEGSAVRNALLAVAMAKHGMPGGETVLEGEAGFYHSYTGNNKGRLSYVFRGPRTTSLDEITAGLGRRWEFLETLYRIYSVPGFNIAHIDVTAAICEEHDIRPEDVDRVEAVVNWMETLYPSPAFPTPGGNAPRVGSTQYYSAHAVVKRGFPLVNRPGDPPPPEAVDLMQRVTLIPSKRQTLFGPKISIFTKDGKKYTRQATGREFIWDFDAEARRIRGVLPGVPVSEQQFEALIEACRDLDGLTRADELIALTLPRR